MSIVIGGFSKFGSSVYLKNFTKDGDFVYIDYNSKRLEIFVSIIRNFPGLVAQKVYFQPAICFPSFIRDILIVILLRVFFSKITFIILSQLHYKNKLLPNKFFRYLFFGRSEIISSAALSSSWYFQKSKIVSPDVKPFDLPVAALKQDGAIIHLGYLSPIKGYDNFIRVTSNLENKVIVIGAELDKHVVHDSNVYVTVGVDEFKHRLKEILNKEKILCFLYCSKFDLSPLLLLEIRRAKIPLVVLSTTPAELILKNYLKQECFVVINSSSELKNIDINKLSASAEFLCNTAEPFAHESRVL